VRTSKHAMKQIDLIADDTNVKTGVEKGEDPYQDRRYHHTSWSSYSIPCRLPLLACHKRSGQHLWWCILENERILISTNAEPVPRTRVNLEVCIVNLFQTSCPTTLLSAGSKKTNPWAFDTS
jgi:hypothetical protein